MSRIVMAVTTQCTRCPMYAAQLDRVGVEYEIVDIQVDEAMRALVCDTLGYAEAPVFLHLEYSDGDVLAHTAAYDKRLLQQWHSEAFSAA
ncbi:glutaredoxin domain-containing protein [Dietzia maris]|uniref:glutaredoxin domain-containing protein n=1 Tax=Dietzia maris TaxID=37915 RepID=UPI0037C771A9